MRSRPAASLALLLAALVVVPLARTAAPGAAPAPLPERLADTGLYGDWATKTVAQSNMAFAPQYPLWTDGAEKSRWLFLPRGSWIDASDPDAWEFPVGTRVWKEFRFHGAPAETRFIERTAEGWRYASYAWRPDGSATLAPARGILNSLEIADGIRHAIPSRADCTACHEAGPSRLLGLGTLQLSADRDPGAPHAEPVPAGGVTLRELLAAGLVRNLPEHLVARAPRIEAPTPVSRTALGYLHGNCGMCHTRAGEMASLDFVLQYTFAPAIVTPPPAWQTTLAQPSHFTSAAHPAVRDRVAPGDPDRSMLVARMASRHPVLQMPPLGSRIVDADAVALLRRWIAEDTRQQSSTRQAPRPERTHADRHP